MIKKKLEIMDERTIEELAFYVTNELENEGMLSQGISILTIEDAIKKMIVEFLETKKRVSKSRYASEKVHWQGKDDLAYCHTPAKNPRLTIIPEFVTCRRCMPEAHKMQIE